MKFLNQTPPKNNQDAFNRIIAWLNRPGATICMNSSNQCVYRNNKNNACAIGTLMPDSMAEKLWGSIHNVTEYIDISVWFENCNLEFLNIMQKFHDDVFFASWSRNYKDNYLNDIIRRYNLTLPNKEEINSILKSAGII